MVEGFKDVVECLNFSGDLVVFGTSGDTVIVLCLHDVEE
jgi:hypothetical protein